MTLVHQLVTRCHGWQSIFNTILQKPLAFVFFQMTEKCPVVAENGV